MYYLLIVNRKSIIINDKNYKLDNYKYITNLKFIIKYIIEFIVKIEISLNIQCILFTDFINKIDKNNKNININDYENYNYNIKPTIFKLFKLHHEDITTNINSSTSILLLLKLISKISINNYDSNSNIFIDEILKDTVKKNDTTDTNDTTDIYNNYNIYIKKKKYINKKTKLYLDEFMLNITKYFFTNTNNNIYIICSNYIFNNVELLFNNFENIFSILEHHLLKSININENKKVKLLHLKTVITNLVEIQIDNVKKLFYI